MVDCFRINTSECTTCCNGLLCVLTVEQLALSLPVLTNSNGLEHHQIAYKVRLEVQEKEEQKLGCVLYV
jgi:hypothetical protein